MDQIINQKIFGQKAIDIYNARAPEVQLSRFLDINEGLYRECSLAEAESALQSAKKLGNDFILRDPEKAVMLIGWGYSKHQNIEIDYACDSSIKDLVIKFFLDLRDNDKNKLSYDDWRCVAEHIEAVYKLFIKKENIDPQWTEDCVRLYKR